MHYILPLLLAAAIGPPIEVQTLDGQSYRGTIAALDDRQLTLATPDKPVSLLISDLQQLRPQMPVIPRAVKPGAWLELVDGSQLLVEQYAVERGAVRFALLGGGAAQMPARRVRAVRFKEQSPAQAAEWAKIRARAQKGELSGDLIVLRKGDHLDFVAGVLGDVGPQVADFRLDNDHIRVPRTKIEGLIYFHFQDSEPLSSAVAGVMDDVGSRFAVARLVLSDGALRIATPAGLEITRPLGSVAQIDFSTGKVVYLSDLVPESAEWTPYFSAGRLRESLGHLFSPRKDHALVGGETAGDDGALQLRFVEANGATTVRSFTKGLAMHSRTAMVYALPEKFRHFKATVGIDARVGNQGHVRLVVRGDERELYAGDFAGGDPPRILDLDVVGVHKLRLLADFAEHLDVADHLDLCDAKLVK